MCSRCHPTMYWVSGVSSMMSNIFQMAVLIYLPLFAVQVRYMLYIRRPDSSTRTLGEGLKEAVPHDFSIMGMTLGFATVTLSFTPNSLFDAGSFFNSIPVLLALAFGPLYLTTFIPFLKDWRLQMFFGVIAYFWGAGMFLFLGIQGA
jgi:hypothetical protein